MGKQYVPVILRINEDGKIIPIQFKVKTRDGAEWVKIAKITDSCRRANLRCGSVGTRYRCVINYQDRHKEIYLFDEGEKWWIEADD